MVSTEQSTTYTENKVFPSDPSILGILKDETVCPLSFLRSKPFSHNSFYSRHDQTIYQRGYNWKSPIQASSWWHHHMETLSTFSEGNWHSPTRQCECILSWASRKLAWVSEILYRTYKGHLFSGECSRNLVSHTDITGPLWGESTSNWWIPLTKGQ